MKTLSPSADACTRKARQPTLQAIPFPDLPNSSKVSHADFWLAAWARDVAAQAALVVYVNSPPVVADWVKNAPLSLALSAAEGAARDSVIESVRNLKDVGGLLFAFPGTTKLQQVAA